MLKMIAAVFRHEVKDLIRDSATLKTMSILLIILPMMYSYLVGNMKDQFQEVLDKEKRVGYLNQEEIEDVLPWLEQQGIVPVPVKEVTREAFTKESLDAIIAARPKDELDSADKIQSNIDIWTIGTNEKKNAAARFVQKQLLIYGANLAKQNLIMAGAAPQLLEPIHTEVLPLESEGGKSSIAHSLLIALLGMALSFTTLHVAVDATAGERERQTLESLLYTSAPRSAIVIGKFLFVSFIAFSGMFFTGTWFYLLGEVSVFQELLGRTGGFSYKELLIGTAILAPACPMIAGIQILIGTFSQSVKQAQAYNSISAMISFPLSFLLFIEQIKPFHYFPIFGQGLAYRKILQGEDWDPMTLFAAELASIAIALLTLLLIIRRFQNERIILNKS